MARQSERPDFLLASSYVMAYECKDERIEDPSSAMDVHPSPSGLLERDCDLRSPAEPTPRESMDTQRPLTRDDLRPIECLRRSSRVAQPLGSRRPPMGVEFLSQPGSTTSPASCTFPYCGVTWGFVPPVVTCRPLAELFLEMRNGRTASHLIHVHNPSLGRNDRHPRRYTRVRKSLGATLDPDCPGTIELARGYPSRSLARTRARAQRMGGLIS